MSDRRFHAIAAFALAALTVALYAQTVDDEWHFDDLGELTPGVRSFAPGVGETQYRGNLVLWLWAIDYRLGGEDPAGYHVTNALIHLANALVVYWLAWMLAAPGSRRFAALGAAALFCAHPLATEAVTYLTQRSTSAAALFFLLTLALWIQGRHALGGRRWAWWTGALATFGAGLHAKHVVVLAPAAIAGYEVLFRPRPRGLGVIALVPFVVLAAARTADFAPHLGARAAPRVAAMVETASAHAHTRREYALTQPRVIAEYLRLVVLPRGQNLDREVRPSRSGLEPAVVGSLALLLAIAAAGVAAARPFPTTALGVLVFFVALLPTSSVVRSPDLSFEHRMYLPLAGLCLALSPLAASAARRRPALAGVALAAAVAALSTATVRRNAVWDTELSLWTDTVAKSPDKARPRVNLALALREAGRLDESERELRRALAIDPGYAFASNNLGTILRLRGRADEAEALFRAAIAVRPRYADPRINLGNLAMDRGSFVAAEKWYRDALRLKPRSVPARYNLARSLERQGRLPEAVAEYSRVVDERPDVVSFRSDLGCARLAAGDWVAAESDLRAAIALDGEWAPAWYNLGLLLEASGRLDDADLAFDRAIEIDPTLRAP